MQKKLKVNCESVINGNKLQKMLSHSGSEVYHTRAICQRPRKDEEKLCHGSDFGEKQGYIESDIRFRCH